MVILKNDIANHRIKTDMASAIAPAMPLMRIVIRQYIILALLQMSQSQVSVKCNKM